MTCYFVQQRDEIFVKGYRFLFLLKIWTKNGGKNKTKNLRSKYSRKRLDHAKQSATNALNTASKKPITDKKLLIKLQESQIPHQKII